ncbi:MAG: single-stranded-DNA-specific exonuclease RecJ [Nitrospirae bacterium]|nr:MAG: single-stranded-DNA-specific exonuclease RecJ [Nitrospirota bacterium]
MHGNRWNWCIKPSNELEARAIAEALGISMLTATVLSARGIDRVEEARRWVSSSYILDHNPFEIPDMDRAIERLCRAIQNKEAVCCYGDYDVDGITATSLYCLFLRQQGVNVSVYIPDRQREGYGLNERAIRRLADQGISVILTADCGTTSFRETSIAQQLGIDVIVTDHHQVREPWPVASAFLNPHRPDNRYPFPFLCSGGIAYKLVKALIRSLPDCGSDCEDYSDLAALATIADVVPLCDENRSLVRRGLLQLHAHLRPGLKAVTERLGVHEPWTAESMAFQLAPVINAAGRLAHAKLGVELLTCESMEAGRQIADILVRLNQQRKVIEQQVVEEALQQVGSPEPGAGIVVGARGWHVGVVGIVASRLVERCHGPVAVVAFDQNGHGRGSVRSIEGVDVCQVLQECSDLLDGFGGHSAAAGFQLHEARFTEFRERFSWAVAERVSPENRVPVLAVDAKTHLRFIQPRLIRELDALSPFGVGNPEPVFMASGLEVLEHRTVGDAHLKVVLRQPRSVPVSGIGFRLSWMAEAGLLETRRVDVAFVPELRRWNGLDHVQLRIRDLRPYQPSGVQECH